MQVMGEEVKESYMGRKKALLVVAGGRGVPDVLPLLYLQPKLVLSITSKEGWDGEKPFFDIVAGLPDVEVKPLEHVDAYDLDKCMKACRKLCKPYSDSEWEWTFTITSAPKVLAIAAYEVAKEMGIPCWHIDSQGERVVSLVKKKRVNKQRFFHLSFDEYVEIQGRTCQQKDGPTKDYRSTAEAWTDIAQEVALSAETYHLAPIFYQHKKSGALDQIIKVPIPLPPDIETSPLVRFLVNHGLLYRSGDHSDTPAYFFASKEAAQFLGTGDWLEVYVWHQTNLARFADDYRWGYSVVKEEDHSETSNAGKHKLYLELDLAVMYHAQLVIAECKSVEKPFEIEKPFKRQNDYLRDIDAVAHLLGRTYVGKVFITNQPGEGQSYEIFKRHAHDRNIIVVTREELPKVGEILKEAAMKPKYPRK
jgi:hypothetical protein